MAEALAFSFRWLSMFKYAVQFAYLNDDQDKFWSSWMLWFFIRVLMHTR